MSHLRFELTGVASDGLIGYEVTSAAGRVSTWVASIGDAMVRKQLIDMGWRPPDSDAKAAVESLTPVLRSTLILTAKGFTCRQIATMEKVSLRAVEGRRTLLYERLHVGSTAEAAVIAAKAGVV